MPAGTTKLLTFFYSVIEAKAILGHGLLSFMLFILRFRGKRKGELGSLKSDSESTPAPPAVKEEL